MRLFLNPDQKAYLRELSGEFGLSSSLVSGELKQLATSKLLKSERNGRQVFYRANRRHALFPELHSMVRKALGMDRILESIIERLGNVEQAILIDDYAAGKDTGLIDLVLVGDINQENLADLVAKTERYIDRKIRPLTVRREEVNKLGRVLGRRPRLILWEKSS